MQQLICAGADFTMQFAWIKDGEQRNLLIFNNQTMNANQTMSDT